MLNEATASTVLTASIFVALLSEHVSLAIIAGMILCYVLMRSLVDENEEDKKAAGAGNTDDLDK